MKAFRTELKVAPSGASMDLASGILTQGSCFADAMGSRLVAHKFKALVNPFGVIYNPESIHKALRYAVYNEPVMPHTFLQQGELFANYDFHSEFSALTQDALFSRLTETIGSAHYFLKAASWLILTYGTAWIYRRNDTGEIVANCHKLPASTFSKTLLTAAEIHSSFDRFYESLKVLNPKIKIILTISPVRHIRDTLALNAVSKSVLRVASHYISQAHEDVDYFPAYEMMMDDLRDYRFYKPDMLHPTVEAEDYIWEKFGERYFSTQAKDFIRQWIPILAAVHHKPFHPNTVAHRQFLRDTLKKLDQLSAMADVQEEISWIKQQLIN